MYVIKTLLIKIIINLLIINIVNCYKQSDQLKVYNKTNRFYTVNGGKNVEKVNFKPIYIYSSALSDSNTLMGTNELQHTNFSVAHNSNTEIVNNNSSDDYKFENIDELIQVLENDNHTITSLILDYFFDYGNDYGYNVNDSGSSGINYFTVHDVDHQSEGRGRGSQRSHQRQTKHIKVKKKLKKFVLPLLLAYKLKFIALVPIIISGLVLLTGSTGLAGFFFALFAAVVGLKNKYH